MKKSLMTVITPVEDFTKRFSKFLRLTRVTAYCMRFINNCRQPREARETTTLTTQELDHALMCCVRCVQQNSYFQEIQDLTDNQEVSSSSTLKTLHPFLDQKGILRVGGRLQQSELSYQTMHQIILPPNCHLTKLSPLNITGCITSAHNC